MSDSSPAALAAHITDFIRCLSNCQILTQVATAETSRLECHSVSQH
jgi:hypothetical protein